MAKTRDWTEILIRRGVIGPDQLKEAQRVGGAVEDSLVKLGYAEAEDIMKAKAEQHGLPFIELREIEIPPSVIELVPESLARENIVMPLAQGSGTIKVIMHDPLGFETIEKLRFVLNREIEVALAPKEAIVEAINKYYGRSSGETESVDSMLQEFTDTAIDFAEDMGPGGKSGTTVTLEEGDAPVIKLVHLIIQEAVTMRASDIHIEPFAERVRIRYRIDGVLMERDSAPRRLLGAIVSRLKIMGSIDIAEKRRPQDGRIKILVAGKDIDLRVSILPTTHGQSVVMRILDRDNIKVGLQDLGFADDDFARFKTMVKRPNGILLVTGPTGSGKTTTLYAALNELNRPDVKIITAEDPVEYYLPGVNQCEVKAKIGMTFADHPGDAATEPEHPSGGRNPRFGDGRDRDSGFTDRTPGFQYAAYERCAQRHYTSGRYRHSALPGGQLCACNHGATPGAESLSQVQSAVRATRAYSRRSGAAAGAGQESQLHEGQGVQQLQQEGLSRPDGNLRAHDLDHPDPRDDVQGRIDAGDT